MRRRISKRWPRELYRWVMHDRADAFDWSDDAAWDAYRWESAGEPKPDQHNGYVAGKAWLNVQIEAWKEGLLEGTFDVTELIEDAPEEWRAYMRDAVLGDTEAKRGTLVYQNVVALALGDPRQYEEILSREGWRETEEGWVK